MPEEIKNPYDDWEFPLNFEPRFSNIHIIGHTSREFFITFGIANPPRKKFMAITQLVLTKEHLVELILNLQSQLTKFNEDQGGDKDKSISPRRF